MRSDYSMSTIVVGAGAVVASALAAGLFAVNAVTGRQSSANLTGTVRLGMDANSCQGFVIDNKTGLIRHDQRVVCPEPAKESKRETAKEVKRAPERTEPLYSSGARIDAVRDSFNKR